MSSPSPYFFDPAEKPLSHSVELAAQRAIENALASGHVTLVLPRAFRHAPAARYRSVSPEHQRRERFSDIQRLRETTDLVKSVSKEMGERIDAAEIHPEDAALELGIDFEPMVGPRWYRVGALVFYDRMDLDDWIERQKGRSSTKPHASSECDSKAGDQ